MAHIICFPFKKLWQILCSDARFARFIYVDSPARIKRAVSRIKKHRARLIVSALAGVAVFVLLLVLTHKNTENSDYYTEGDDSVDYAMVLQHYSTFDHREKTHVGLKLSWTDGAVDLSSGQAEIKISAKVYPVNLKYKKIEWQSSDDEIADVDDGGKITVAKAGKVQISAALPEYGKSSSATLEARQPVTGIFMPTSTITLYTNDTSRLLTARIFPEDATNSNVIWKSKNTNIARVDSMGNVKPVGVGMTEITATTEDGGFEGKCFVSVVNPSVDVNALSVHNENDMRITVGESVNAIVTVSPSNAKNKTLSWSSDNEGVAVVNQTGRVLGIGAGDANITVKSVNGIAYSFPVNVSESGEKDPFNLVDENEALAVAALNTEGSVTYTSYNITFPQIVRLQMGLNPPPKIWRTSGHEYATEAETAEYMNPNSYYTDAYKYQFLDLSSPNNVSADVLNAYLENKGVLRGMGEVFIQAGRDFNVSEVYLIAHACLESGNGTSKLARGIEVNGTTVYNMFGINAYDSNPLGGGSSKAYSEGWTSVEAAIRGGAQWISEHYINSLDGRQNTLYKMLWNPEHPGEHQYATDIGWAVKQAISIERIFSSFGDAVLSFDVPVYSGQIPPTISQ
ncbi:MAG: Ig-like domain-containing protein [Oscillospiraceae bacterium]|nr:Ig-like domain-containing protein [Oscillospiraceae bacterium]